MKFVSTPAAWERLAAMKENSRVIGVLSEIQQLQLSTWPKVVWEGARVRLEWDCRARRVNYTVDFGPFSDVTESVATRGCQVLYENIQMMLGDDWEVLVRDRGGNLIFEGCRREPYDPPPGVTPPLTAPPPRGDNTEDVRLRATDESAADAAASAAAGSGGNPTST